MLAAANEVITDFGAEKPANEVITDPNRSQRDEVGACSSEPVAAPQRSPSASACEAYRDAIELGLSRGRNAMAIWQGLVDQFGFAGQGVVFGLRAASAASFIVLHHFSGGSDGGDPYGELVSDANGNLYGTTFLGGSNGAGTVYKLARNKLSVGWKETVLYSFQGTPYGGGNDGANPVGRMVFDQAGNLYGITFFGGPAARGTVFKLSPNPDGGWTETTLYAFTEPGDGSQPSLGITLGKDAALYDTTATGGQYKDGTVFKLTPSGGQWTERILYSFTGGLDGGLPGSGVILDAKGNIYGTTISGGTGGPEQGGVVFELVP